MKKITIIEKTGKLLIIAVLVIFGIGLDGMYHLYSDRMTFTYFIIAAVALALINSYATNATKKRTVKS